MTQNQKWMKLGPGKGQPKAQSVRRLKTRGASWLDAFRRQHEAKKELTRQRHLEEIAKKAQLHKKNGGGNSGQHGNGTAG
jgi:hypothetical protein